MFFGGVTAWQNRLGNMSFKSPQRHFYTLRNRTLWCPVRTSLGNAKFVFG